jgi:hypothetical protein
VNAANQRIALNTLLAVPVGLLGGALAGELISIGVFVASATSGSTPWSLGYFFTISIGYAFFGAVVGVLSFPIAYAAVARTRNMLVIVPAGLIATVIACWIGLAIIYWLDSAFDSAVWLGPWSWLPFALIFVFPVAAMFWACAWAANRERQRIAS